ncbi:MAG: transcriptional repressor LexA [Proteobacteria bacterium]|nr:transcriptional repressor LexA [Pseudomonadota bacterium]
MLTRKQRDLLLFIHHRVQQEGIPPSYEEMKDALGLHSKSGIHRLVGALEERGFLKRLPNRARAIEIIRLPEGVGPNVALSDSKVISAPFGKSGPKEVVAGTAAAANINIPLHGKIAAGMPIEALENADEHISMPPGMLGPGEHYALEISGDSMVDLGILDGDTVIIRKCTTADNGDVVVALVENEEATLKTLHKKGAQVALTPANPDHSTQILPADQVQIQGKLVGLFRKY